MKSTKRIAIFTGVYMAVRLLSFLIEPSSPLHPGNPVNYLLATVFALTVFFLLLRKNDLGWYLIAGEIVLGGTGNYFEVFGVSLRTVLLGIGMSTFFVQEWRTVFAEKKSYLPLAGMLILAAIGALNGYHSGHAIHLIIADTVPYAYLLYYFPLKRLHKEPKFAEFCFDALKAAIIGQTLFILLTFYTFIKGYFILQDTFYHWYRDIANGKITPVEFNFYRLVLNEQLLLSPILIYFVYDAIYKNTKSAYFYITLLLFLLSLNLTRIYMLAIALGGILLFSRDKWKTWLRTTLFSAAAFFVIFCSLSLIASSGRSFGLEILGFRIKSIATPQIEDSSLSRLILLPKVLETIKRNPVFGVGLGSTLDVYSPVLKQTITTSNYDWGYLEILGELGALGFIIWGVFLSSILKHKKKPPNWQFASIISLLTINLTSPALFHVFGILWLTILLGAADRASSE